MNSPECWSCGRRCWRPSYRFGSYQLCVCRNCGLGYLRGPAPDPQELYGATYYASADPRRGYGDYAALQDALQRVSMARLRRIERFLPKRGRLLDVGCGLGAALRAARRRGWRAEGVEVSAAVVQRLRAEGLDVRRGFAEDINAVEGYDCVTMWDTLEHVKDARAACAAAAGVLRPGGVFALTTGDRGSVCSRLSGRRWHLYNIPEHQFFFTAESIRLLLERSGLRPVSLRRRGSWYSLRYIRERMQNKYQLTVPLPRRLAAVNVYLNLYDIMEIHALKVDA